MSEQRTAIVPPSDEEVADLLRRVEFAMDRAETAMVAFVDHRYIGAIVRDYERLQAVRKAVLAALDRYPPEPPMTPEREAVIGNLIGAVLDKRFGDGSQEAVTEAIQRALDSGSSEES